MAYSNIYNVLKYTLSSECFTAYRPNVACNREFISKARKENKPISCNGNAVAFPDNYKIDSDIQLSCYHDSKEVFGRYYFPHKVHYDAVILVVKDLLLDVPVAVKGGFLQSLLKESMVNQTHTFSLMNGIVTISGKFKFNNQFLELVGV